MWSGRGHSTTPSALRKKQNIPRIKGIGRARSVELKSCVIEDMVISGRKAQKKMLVIREVRPHHWQFGHARRAGSFLTGAHCLLPLEIRASVTDNSSSRQVVNSQVTKLKAKRSHIRMGAWTGELGWDCILPTSPCTVSRHPLLWNLTSFSALVPWKSVFPLVIDYHSHTPNIYGSLKQQGTGYKTSRW